MIDVEKCRIMHYPAEVLAKAAGPVEKSDENIRRLVEKMTELMLKNKGIGLAAPQVGVPLRLFIISLDGKKESIKVYINPTVTPISEKAGTPLGSTDEGCLSVPGVFTKIRRYKKCTVTATDLDGNEFAEEAEGLFSRVLQHEYDHIQGMTITNRMGPTAKIAHRRQLKKLIQEHEEKPES
ncbi:MAG: peptide deformylase [Planctomycetota bacterium]|jgi:peptide deformylase